jgi:hypothetical protein
MNALLSSVFARTLVLGVMVAIPREAFAVSPLDIEIAVKVGAGTAPSNSPIYEANALGFGLGGRIGLAISGLYGGVSIVNYFGGTEILPRTGLASMQSWAYGFEGGYGIKPIEALTLRALIGIGGAHEVVYLGGRPATYMGPRTNTVTDTLYIEPGIAGFVSPSSSGWFLGVDINVLVLPDWSAGTRTDVSLTVHGQIGYRF